MDSLPLTAALLGKLFPIKGSDVERYYKHHLSDYDVWEQKNHAADWVLLEGNIGERLSIDETQLCEEVYTILSNKAGHGGQGTVIAIVKGTKADAVSRILMMIPESDRSKVKEITMDFSDSMYSIAKQCFPKATIVIDCFHIVKRLCEGLEEMRLRFKRLAQVENKKAAAAFAQEESRKARNRLYYRRKHKKNPGETRGRKRSVRALFDHMKQTFDAQYAPQHVMITHGDCIDDAHALQAMVQDEFGDQVKDVIINYVDPVIGAHSGPGTLALFFLATSRN